MVFWSILTSNFEVAARVSLQTGETINHIQQQKYAVAEQSVKKILIIILVDDKDRKVKLQIYSILF